MSLVVVNNVPKPPCSYVRWDNKISQKDGILTKGI